MNSQPKLRIVAISLFPDSFDAVLSHGISRKALEMGRWSFDVVNPRDFADNSYQRVDDRPYGGGPGMIMQAPPLKAAIVYAKEALDSPQAQVVYLSPQGIKLDQQMVGSILAGRMPIDNAGSLGSCDLILLCGRYEGVDERLLRHYVDFEVSIGDYVLSGGELPAMVLIDALVRLIPGVCGHEQSPMQDSFSHGLLDHEQYTRPMCFEGDMVPEVLMSGDHQRIETWRRENAEARTKQRRRDLWQKFMHLSEKSMDL